MKRIVAGIVLSLAFMQQPANAQTLSPDYPIFKHCDQDHLAFPQSIWLVCTRVGNYYTTQYRDAWDVIHRTLPVPMMISEGLRV